MHVLPVAPSHNTVLVLGRPLPSNHLCKVTASRLTKISPESSCREQRRPLLQGPQLVFQLPPLLQGLVPALLLDHGCILLAVGDHWEGALRSVGDPLQGAQKE